MSNRELEGKETEMERNCGAEWKRICIYLILGLNLAVNFYSDIMSSRQSTWFSHHPPLPPRRHETPPSSVSYQGAYGALWLLVWGEDKVKKGADWQRRERQPLIHVWKKYQMGGVNGRGMGGEAQAAGRRTRQMRLWGGGRDMKSQQWVVRAREGEGRQTSSGATSKGVLWHFVSVCR